MVNRGAPDNDNVLYVDLPNLPERHGREDWNQAKLGAAKL